MSETGEGIDMAIITKIADKIADLGEFKDTLNSREGDEEFSHGYNAVRMFNTIVIQSAYFDCCSNETSYFLYDESTDTLREATPMEDTFIREAELGDYPFLDLDQEFKAEVVFIIGRDFRNDVHRADVPEDDSDYVKPTPDDIEKHRETWAKVAKENGWYNEPFFVQIWYDKTTGEVKDSVSTRALKGDVLIPQ